MGARQYTQHLQLHKNWEVGVGPWVGEGGVLYACSNVSFTE